MIGNRFQTTGRPALGTLMSQFRFRSRALRISMMLIVVVIGQRAAIAQGPDSTDVPAADGVDTDDILDMDLESLGRVDVVAPSFAVEVTSVTKSEGTVGKSPAAIYVITNEMIRRSGVTSVPEALRMAPGLVVSRLDGNKWAVSSRGFNGLYANKLQVLIDGRSIYTPIFSGVRWDRNDVILEDVERIEVIRGPGASVWGANAVNGVINIITKDAHSTQGLLVSSGGGTEDRNINTLRFGGSNNDGWAYRIYGKHADRDGGRLNGQDGADSWERVMGGIRTDWRSDEDNQQHFTLIAEGHEVNAGSNVVNFPASTPPFFSSYAHDGNKKGASVLARWTEKLSDSEHYSFQAYYDHRDSYGIYGGDTLNVADFEFQHVRELNDQHSLTWGMAYRLMSDQSDTTNAFALTFDPAARTTSLYSAFVQDEITLRPEELFLTLGCKFEHNDYTGFEFQPTARLLRVLDERNVVWGAASRAVRTPSRVDNDIDVRFLVAPTPVFSNFKGNRNLGAEDLMAYELGYRSQPSDRFSWDVAGFFNDYNDLMSTSPFSSPTGMPLTLAAQSRTRGRARTWGAEMSATYQMSDAWTLSGWYAYMDFRTYDVEPGTYGNDTFAHNHARLTSSHDINDQLQLDAMLRFVDAMSNSYARPYWSLDMRMGWKLNENWDAMIVGQNLLEGERIEYHSDFTHEAATAAQRGVFASLTFRH